jgi:hypothetical protein
LVVVDIARYRPWHGGGRHQFDDFDVIGNDVGCNLANHRQPLRGRAPGEDAGEVLEEGRAAE